MRFVLISTHVDQTTGYSKVSYNLVKQLGALSPKVKTFHFGFQRHPKQASLRKYPEGVIPYDAAANEDPKEEGFGFNKVYEYLEMVGPDVVMIYNDPLIVARFIESIKHKRGESPYKLWIYLDQVYTGIAQPLVDSIHEHADRIYCFTDIWKQRFLEYGPFPDVRVLEHAVDPTIFTCLSDDSKRDIRKNIGVPNNAVLFLNANRNSQRKRLDLSIAGFVRLLARNPDKLYYMMIATNVSPQSGAYYDVQRIFLEELQLYSLDLSTYVRRLILMDTAPPNIINDEAINHLYNAADVGLNTSDGEGFGLCQLEHMYTGAPQVVTDIGSYRSFLDETVAEFIPASGRFYFSGGMPFGLYAPLFDPDAIATAMEKAVSSLYAKQKVIVAHKFKSWPKVCDEWLEDILTESGAQVSTVSVQVLS